MGIHMPSPSKRVLALLATLCLLAGGCGGDGDGPGQPAEPGQEEPEEQSPAAANFTMGEVRVIDSQDRPEAGANAGNRLPQVVNLINGYYNTAFVDPAKWGDGAHPELAGFFTEEAKPHVGPRIGVLALGDVSRSVTDVRPDKQSIDRLTFYFDADPGQPLGVVTTSFEATATPSEEDGEPVKILHSGTFWLQPEGDGFRISAFDAAINVSQGAA